MKKKRRKIRATFAAMAAIAIMGSIMVVFATTYTQLTKLLVDNVEVHAEDNLKALETTIQRYLDESAKAASGLASYTPLIDACDNNDDDALYKAVDSYYNTTNMSTNCITLTDDQGVVKFRYYSDKKDDSIANLEYVQKALNNETTTGIAQGNNIKLGARTGTPMKNSAGKIVGVISITYPLDNDEIVDELKGDTQNEYTIFMNDERICTTIMENNQRAVGSKMSSEISKAVLNEQKTYTASTEIFESKFMAAYMPLTDSDGEVVGAIFAGLHLDEITQNRMTTFIVCIVIAAGVSVLVIILVSVVAGKTIVNPVIELGKAAGEMAAGNLKLEIKEGPNNEIGDLSDSLREVQKNLNLYISDIAEHMDSLASGDMTREVTINYIGDFSSIKNSINKIINSLDNTLSSINTAADQVNSGAEQVATAAQSLSQGATEQASSIQQLTSSIMSVSEQVNQNAQNVNTAGSFVSESKKGIESSNTYMQQMVSAMNDINESSAEISKIIKVIDDIAFQTNILALNAAVEAARAGAAGKGFSVVADEVRNLASKSADAAKQTTRLIEGSVSSVEKGMEIAKETAKALEDVSEHSEKVVESIQKIQEASNQQAEAINQITIGLEQISSVVQTNSATSEESAAASEELSGQAQMLQQEISQFRLRDSLGGSMAGSYREDPVSAPDANQSLTINLDDDKY